MGLLLLVALMGTVPTGAEAQIGEIRQISPSGCIRDTFTTIRPAGCEYSARGLYRPSGLTASSDGRNVYVINDVPDSSRDTVTAFSRNDKTGRLTQLGSRGCHYAASSSPAVPDCLAAKGLVDPSGIAVSPNGRFVAVSSRSAGTVVLFSREVDGSLTQLAGTPCIESYEGLSTTLPTTPSPRGCYYRTRYMMGPTALTFSPDSSSLYVAAGGEDSDKGLNGAAFAFNVTGWSYRNCVVDSSLVGNIDCERTPALLGVNSIAAKGNQVYLGSTFNSSIAALDTNSSGFVPRSSGSCIKSGDGHCTPGQIEGLSGIAVSNSKLYATSLYSGGSSGYRRGALTTFERQSDGGLGALQQCLVSLRITAPSGCRSDARGIESPAGLAMADNNIYLASSFSGGMAAFDASPGFNPIQASGLSGCIVDPVGSYPTTGCGNATGAYGAQAIAASPDGKHIYLAASLDLESKGSSKALITLANTFREPQESEICERADCPPTECVGPLCDHGDDPTDNPGGSGSPVGGAGATCATNGSYYNRVSVPKAIRAKYLGGRGFKTKVWASTTGRGTLTVSVSKKDARKLKLARKGKKESRLIASRRVAIFSNERSVKVKLAKKARKRLKRALKKRGLKGRVKLKVTLATSPGENSKAKAKSSATTSLRSKGASKSYRQAESRAVSVNFCEQTFAVKLNVAKKVKQKTLVKGRSRSGKGVKATVYCSNSCSGKVTINLRNTGRNALRVSRKKKKYIPIGTATVTLAAGQSKAIKVKIGSKKARKKLLKLGRRSRKSWSALRFNFEARDSQTRQGSAKVASQLKLKRNRKRR